MAPAAGYPVVRGDRPRAGADKPAVLIHGHFDVQPAALCDLRQSPPFASEIRDRKFLGRGATDATAGMLIAILSAEVMPKTTGRQPIDANFFLDGRDKIGSTHLPPVIKSNGALPKADMIFSADGSQPANDQPI